MGKIIGYGKLGRSMPLTLERCGNLGGDVEMVAVVRELALRHPDDTFLLIGRNSGEDGAVIAPNVINPWTARGWSWKSQLDESVCRYGLKDGPLTVERQLTLADVFDKIVGPMFDELDAFVMWVGQHGTSNVPIPRVDDPSNLTKPQDWCAWYAGWMLRGINRWRDVNPLGREEISLNADPRNLHKMRDLKWPLRHPVLGQHNSSKPIKHERYGDGRDWEEWSAHDYVALRTPEDVDQVWLSRVYTAYSRLEVNGLRPGTPFGDLITFDPGWNRPGNFGLFINEARSIGVRPALQRKNILREWVLPLEPHFIHGTWSKESGFSEMIKPAPWDRYCPSLHSVRCTFTTPSSGSGWATAKPWEAFAAGTVCFFHPAYDDQDNILGDADPDLHGWLRVTTSTELKTRIEHLGTTTGRNDWSWLINAQRRHFDRALEELTYMEMIEERIYG